jgi:signal peptidase complex subunit 3
VSSQVLNQVVVWDQIISEPQQAVIRSSSIANKYSLTDQGYGLRGNNVTLVVNWNNVPSTGLLTLQHDYRAVHSFIMPTEYSTS